MKSVTARLHDQIDRATSITASLGATLGLHGELIHGVYGKNDAGDAGDTALILGGDVVPEVVVIHAVNLPIHLVGTRPVEGAEAAHGIAPIAGIHRDQLGEIAPVKGNILHHLRLDGLGLSGSS